MEKLGDILAKVVGDITLLEGILAGRRAETLEDAPETVEDTPAEVEVDAGSCLSNSSEGQS